MAVNGRRFVSYEHDINKVHTNRYAAVSSRDEKKKKKKKKKKKSAGATEGLSVCSIQLILVYRPFGDRRIYDLIVGDFYPMRSVRNRVCLSV
jgi:hypothetical protein